MLVPSVTYTLLNEAEASEVFIGHQGLEDPSPHPSPRSGHCLHYSPAIGCSVLVGGLSHEECLRDVWTMTLSRNFTEMDRDLVKSKVMLFELAEEEIAGVSVLANQDDDNPQQDAETAPHPSSSSSGALMAPDYEPGTDDRAVRWKTSYEEWSPVPLSRRVGFGFASCLFDNNTKLFMHGGVADGGDLIDSPYVLDLITRSWSQVDMTEGPIMTEAEELFMRSLSSDRLAKIGGRWGHSASLVKIPAAVARNNGWFTGDDHADPCEMFEFIVVIGGDVKIPDFQAHFYTPPRRDDSASTSDIYIIDPKSWNCWHVPNRKAACLFEADGLQRDLKVLADAQWNVPAPNSSGESDLHVDPNVPPPPPPGAVANHFSNPLDNRSSLFGLTTEHLKACLEYGSAPLAVPPPRRRHAAAAHRDRFVFIFGGRSIPGDEFRNDTWIFDSYKCLWHHLTDDLDPKTATAIFNDLEETSSRIKMLINKNTASIDRDHPFAAVLRDFDGDLHQRLKLPIHMNAESKRRTFGLHTPECRTGSSAAVTEDGTLFIQGGFSMRNRFVRQFNELKGLRLNGPFSSSISPFFIVNSTSLSCTTVGDMKRIPPEMTMSSLVSIPKPPQGPSPHNEAHGSAYLQDPHTKYMLLFGGRVGNTALNSLYLLEVKDEVLADDKDIRKKDPLRAFAMGPHNAEPTRTLFSKSYTPARITKPLAAACVDWFVSKIPFKDLDVRHRALREVLMALTATKSGRQDDEASQKSHRPLNLPVWRQSQINDNDSPDTPTTPPSWSDHSSLSIVPSNRSLHFMFAQSMLQDLHPDILSDLPSALRDRLRQHQEQEQQAQAAAAERAEADEYYDGEEEDGIDEGSDDYQEDD